MVKLEPLSDKTIGEIMVKVAYERRSFPLRLGQSFINQLGESGEEHERILCQMILGTSIDPYYNDELLGEAIMWLTKEKMIPSTDEELKTYLLINAGTVNLDDTLHGIRILQQYYPDQMKISSNPTES